MTQNANEDILNILDELNITSSAVFNLNNLSGAGVSSPTGTNTTLFFDTDTELISYVNTSTSGILGIVPTFGTQYQFVEDASVSTTTSTTFQPKLNLTTPSVPAGDYRMSVYYNWGLTGGNPSIDFRARVQLDTSTTIFSHQAEPKDTGADQLNVASGFDNFTLTAGVHTLDLEFATSSGTRTAVIQNTRLEIFRIS